MPASRDPLQPFAVSAATSLPNDLTPNDIESRAELSLHLSHGSLAGLNVLGLRLEEDAPNFAGVDVTDTLFVGCHFDSLRTESDLVLRGAHVIPPFDALPYETHPARLYTAEDLAEGFAESGFAGMFDTIVYRHFLAHGGASPDVREAIAQRLHDAGIDTALAGALSAWAHVHGRSAAVGIMGGHAVLRGSDSYVLAAELAQRLTVAGRLIITGGGPGVMEAANLGSYMAEWPKDRLLDAIARLAAAPDFHDHEPYTAAALDVRAGYPHTMGTVGAAEDMRRGGLAVPTWLYGHEPANLFAGLLAKYFSNAVREEMILRLSRGGIVFAPGQAGTVQEVFQAATMAFYRTNGAPGPFILLGTEHWSALPVVSLLKPLFSRAPGADLSHLITVTDSPDEAADVLLAWSPDGE